MKKLLTVLILFICLKSLGQNVPSNFVPRNTYEKVRGMYPDSVFHLPTGCGFPSLLTTKSWKGGAALYGDTCNNKLYFYRDTAWVYIPDSTYTADIIDSSSSSITNIYNNSVVNIGIVNDTCLSRCTGAGVCDTVCTNITITSFEVLNCSTVVAIGYLPPDSLTVVRDTLTFGTCIPVYIYQNWLRQTAAGIYEFGSPSPFFSPGLMLSRTTYTNTGYYQKYWDGITVYNSPHNFRQQQSFQNGNSIVSFLHYGNPAINGYNNDVRMLLNYVDSTYATGPYISGQLGPTRGYTFGNNWRGVAQGTYLDNNNSKTSFITFHDFDSLGANATDGMTFYTAPDLGGTAPVFNGTLTNYKSLILGTNGGLKLPRYIGSTFNGGTSSDSVLVINESTGQIYKRNPSSFGGGGINSDTLTNYWRLTGNTATAGTLAGSFFGTTNNVSARFRTNNTERMVLDSNGRLGIATTAPTFLFETSENSTNTTTAGWKIANAGNGDAVIHFLQNTQNYSIGIDQSNSSRFYISANATLGTSNGLIIASDGSVGLAGASPAAKVTLPAGTASAFTAPLKFTVSGAALATVPADGQIEVLVDSIYYTGNSDVRRRLAYADEVTASTWQQTLTTGSTLTTNNTITQGSTTFQMDGSTTASQFYVNNSTNGNAIKGQNAGNNAAIWGETTTGQAFVAIGGENAELFDGTGTQSNTTSIRTIANWTLNSTGTPSAGFGQRHRFLLETSTTASSNAADWLVYWNNATHTNRTVTVGFGGISNAIQDTLLRMGSYTSLTESTATTFATTTVATGRIGGGEIVVTIEANDATDYQARTLRFIYSAVNKAGTTTVTISTPEEVVSTSAGTLTATITAVDSGSGVVQFQANAVSSLTQTTLRATHQISKNF